jgi:hypothetical protein
VQRSAVSTAYETSAALDAINAALTRLHGARVWHHVSRESSSCAGRARVGYLAVDHNCFAGRCHRDHATQRVGRHGHHPIRNAGDRVADAGGSGRGRRKVRLHCGCATWGVWCAWFLRRSTTQLHWQGASGASAAPRSRRRRRRRRRLRRRCVHHARAVQLRSIGRPGRTWRK